MPSLGTIKLIGIGLLLLTIAVLYVGNGFLRRDLAKANILVKQEKANADLANAAVLKWQQEAADRQKAVEQGQQLATQLTMALEAARGQRNDVIIEKLIPVPGACPMPVAPLLPGLR